MGVVGPAATARPGFSPCPERRPAAGSDCKRDATRIFMAEIDPNQLRHIRRLAEDADAAFDRLRNDVADARDELQQAQRQQEQAHRGAPPQRMAVRPSDGEHTVIRAPAGRHGEQGGDDRDAADARVDRARQTLQRLQAEQKAAGEHARHAKALWRNCADYARKHGVELDVVSQPGTPSLDEHEPAET
jgi:hypothetical protein